MVASAKEIRPQRVAVATRTQASAQGPSAATPSAPEAEAIASAGIGDTLVDEKGVAITLVSVTDISGFEQSGVASDQMGAAKPRNDLFRVVTFEVVNNSSEVESVNNTNISLFTASGSRVRVDSPSTSMLTTASSDVCAGRPLFLVEAIAAGRSALVSVSFDLEQSDEDFELSIQGLLFALPPIEISVAIGEEDLTAKKSDSSEGRTEATDASAGSTMDFVENRGRARFEAEEQTAVSRSGLPTIGDTLVGDDGLEVTLVSVQDFDELVQIHGTPYRPKNGSYKIVSVMFKNTTESTNIVVSKDNIYLVGSDDEVIKVDSPGVNALIGMATTTTEGRPLFMVESVPGGKKVTVAVVFDLPSDSVDMNIEIEGFLFEVPNPE